MFFRGRGLLCTAPICLALACAANKRVISDAPATGLFLSDADAWKNQGSVVPQSQSYPRENETTVCNCE